MFLATLLTGRLAVTIATVHKRIKKAIRQLGEAQLIGKKLFLRLPNIDEIKDVTLFVVSFVLPVFVQGLFGWTRKQH